MSSKRTKRLAQELRKRAPSKAYEQGFGENGGVASLGTTYEDLDSDGVPDTIVKNSPRIGAFKRTVGVVSRGYLAASNIPDVGTPNIPDVGTPNIPDVGTPNIPAVWTPNSLIDPANFWIDASDPDTVSLISGKIQSITDKTGNSFTVTAPTSSQRPTQSTWQGRNAIQIFDTGATGDRLETASNVIGELDNFTIFSVMTGTEIARGASGDWSLRLIDHHIQIIVLTGGAAVSPHVTKTPPGKLQVAMFDQSAKELNLSINGSSYITSSGTNTRLRPSVNNLFLQLGVQNSGHSVAGHIGEVIILTRVATDDEKYKIEGYLAWRWGLEAYLPADHTYKSSAP